MLPGLRAFAVCGCAQGVNHSRLVMLPSATHTHSHRGEMNKARMMLSTHGDDSGTRCAIGSSEFLDLYVRGDEPSSPFGAGSRWGVELQVLAVRDTRNQQMRFAEVCVAKCKEHARNAEWFRRPWRPSPNCWRYGGMRCVLRRRRHTDVPLYVWAHC